MVPLTFRVGTDGSIRAGERIVCREYTVAWTILTVLLSRPGRVVPMGDLIDACWHPDEEPEDAPNNISRNMWTLRRRLEGTDHAIERIGHRGYRVVRQEIPKPAARKAA